jgi:hypothetical protein
MNSPAEIPMKRWRLEMAEKLGISGGNLNHLIYRGKIKLPQVRRVNSRVIFVKVEPHAD